MKRETKKKPFKPRLERGFFTRVHIDKQRKDIDNMHKREIDEAYRYGDQAGFREMNEDEINFYQGE